MSDTQRSLVALQALLADNNVEAISEQDLRDALVSALGGYGSISVQDGTTAQTGIGTTPSQLGGFAANGPSSGTTPDQTSSQIAVGVAADYGVAAALYVTGTPSRTVQVRLRKNGLEVNGVGARATFDASGGLESLVLAGQVTCLAADILALYVEADQAGTSVTLVDGNFSVKRLS